MKRNPLEAVACAAAQELPNRPQGKNSYNPRPRKPIRYKMDTNDVTLNSKYGSGDADDYDYDYDYDGVDVDFQQDEIEIKKTKVSSRAASIRQKQDQIKPECKKRPSHQPARKQGSQEARADHPWMVLCVIGVIAAIFVYNLYGGWGYPGKVLPPSNVAVTKSEREKYLRIGIQQIHDEFPSQLNTTWLVFSAGIKEVQETPTKPSLFLLLHETEEWTPACLAWKIGNISAHFLNARNPYPVVLDGANIEKNQTLVEDYGILLDEYSPMVEERCVMIVKDLHKIPGTVAQSFHWFCDTVTPLVDKAVYLFTMKVSGVGHAKDNPYTLAEKELRRLWNAELDEDKLMPLIARITDTVMVIMPEKNHTPCPDGTIVPEREH